MNDHTNHDLELLAAYASGHEPDRAASEALLSSCGECRLAYEEQVRMRSVLSEVGRAQLSDGEQSRLLAAVGAALPAPVHRLKERRPKELKTLSPIWGRMMAAAAAMAVVVGVGATVASQQGSDASATTAVLQTRAAPEFAAGGATNDAREAATTAAAASELYGLDADDPARLKTEAEGLAVDTTAQEGGTATTLACAQATEDLAIRARGESTYQDRRVLLFLAEDEGELSPRAFFADDCTEIVLP